MPTYIRAGSWKLIKDIYIRIGSAWKTVSGAWVYVNGAWKLVHSGVQTPYPSGDIVIRDYLDVNPIDNDIYISNVGDTIYGRRGPTWLNSPTAFQYRWRYSTSSGGPYQDFSPAETTTTHPSPLDTSSPLSRINAWNDRWIVYQVRAQNAEGWSEWFTSVNEAHLVKYVPYNLTLSITGTPGPGSTLTATSTWQNTNLYTNDQSPASYLYEWYDDNTNELIYSDTVNTFIPSIEDLNRYVRVEVTATNTGGSSTATSAAVGPIEFVLAVEIPTVAQEEGDQILDNRGGIINGVSGKVSAIIYGVTAYTSYRVRYRYRNVQTGTYLLDGAASTSTLAWVTFTANPSGFGDISEVVVDDVNRVTTLYDLFYINEVHYDGSTYTAGSVVSGAKYQVEIQVSVVRPDNTAVSRTLTYGISAAPVPTITATPSTVATNSDVVFSGTIGGLAGKPAFPTEFLIDYGDGSALENGLFSAGDANPTYSIAHQYEEPGTYDVEISTYPPFETATTSVTAVLAPGAFSVLSVVKGLSNGSTRPVTVTWEQSANATEYEVEIQRQYANLSGWVTVQSFEDSIYINEPTRTYTFDVSPVAKYYRASVRARRDYNISTAAYSDYGTLESPSYVDAIGIAPSAPTSLSAGSITTTTASISFTAPSSFGSAALAYYQWSKDGFTWVTVSTTTSPIAVYDLTAGSSVTVQIRAVNGDDVEGPSGSVTFTTSTAPGAFNIISAVKGAYDTNLARSIGDSNGYPATGSRPIVISWGQSVNADRYEVQVEARDYHPVIFPNASQTWIVLRSLNSAPYVTEPIRTETFNAAFYWQFRVTARARSGTDLPTAAYSNGGTSTSYVYYDVTGTAPQPVTVGTATSITATTASVPYTLPTNTGSAGIARTEYSLNLSTWTITSSSPVALTGLTGSTNYVLYMRTTNSDGLVSSNSNSPTFTTSTPAPTLISAPGISTNTGNYSAGSVITGTTGSWSGASSYLIEIVRATTTPITSNSSPVSNVYTITVGDAGAPSYYFATKVTAYSGPGQTGLSTIAYSSTSSRSYLVPTVTTPTLSGATGNGFTVSWSSGPASYHSSNVLIYNSSLSLVATISNQTSPYTWTGGSGNTTYYARVQVVANDSFSSSTTSSYSSSITTLTPFVTPTCPAPSLNFRRFPTNTSSSWEYFCDYPSPSGSVQSITGMQYEIYSANSTGGATIAGGAGILAYPGAFTYPYTSSRLGSSWAFRIASGSGGRVATTAGRYGRVRVVMLGTNGSTYYGTWTSPLL